MEWVDVPSHLISIEDPLEMDHECGRNIQATTVLHLCHELERPLCLMRRCRLGSHAVEGEAVMSPEQLGQALFQVATESSAVDDVLEATVRGHEDWERAIQAREMATPSVGLMDLPTPAAQLLYETSRSLLFQPDFLSVPTPPVPRPSPSSPFQEVLSGAAGETV